MDRNVWINIALFGLTGFLSWNYSLWFLLTPILFHLVNDLLHWKANWTIFDTEAMVRRGYEVGNQFLSNQSGEGIDLGFNFYEGDLSRKREVAQKAKWDFMIQQLGLKPGHKLIDIGCGFGDWIRYARSKGIIVKGVNMTRCQAKIAKEKYGLDVLNINWKEILKNPALQKELFGQFDAVTFMDTIEHYVPAHARYSPEIQKKIYTDTFYLAYKLLNPQSEAGRVFFSCLHQIRKNWSFLEAASVWSMNRSMSGFYPIGDHGLTENAMPFFKELNRVDRTEDYRLTAVLEKDHFQGNSNIFFKPKMIWIGLKALIVDPYFIQRLIGLALDHWMRLYGKDRYEKRYDPEKRLKTSIVRLWMVTLQRKPEAASS